MKKTTKRFITLLLSIFVLFTSVQIPASVMPDLSQMISISASAANYSVNYWSYAEPTRTLKHISPNQKGNDVKWFQCAINNLIINGDKNNKKLSTPKLDVDGVFGKASKAAVIAFQKKYNLEADGLFGPASRKKMKSVLKGSSHIHSYKYNKTVKVTCKSDGYKLYKCSCGATDKRNIVKATGHRYSKFYVDRINFTLTSTCTKCKVKDRDISYDEYCAARDNPPASKATYYYQVFKILCPGLTDNEIRTRAENALYVEKNANASSNIFINYRRPDGTGGFDRQTKRMMKLSRYVGKKNFTINVTYKDEFCYIWNYVIPFKVNEIQFFGHGAVNTLEFFGEGETLRMERVDPGFKATGIKDTHRSPIRFYNKNVKTIYLYSCQGGTKDPSYANYEKKLGYYFSTSAALARVCRGANVVSLRNDGVDYNDITLLPECHTPLGVWIKEKCPVGSNVVQCTKLGFFWRLV